MMSAPSWASRMAWLRPCPRAAPVMKATLPCTRPVIGFLSLAQLLDERYSYGLGAHKVSRLPVLDRAATLPAAADQDVLPGDPGRGGRGEVEHGRGDVLGRAQP